MTRLHIYSALCSVFFLLCITSCGENARERLRRQVEAVNSECPTAMGALGVFESARLDGDSNTTVFTFALNEDNIEIAGLADATQEQKQSLAAFLNYNEQASALLGALINADASIRMVYRGMESGDSVTIDLSQEDLRTIASKEISENTDRFQLESMVAVTNRRCPIQSGEGITLTGLRLIDNYMVYRYKYNPSAVNLSPANTDTLQVSLTEGLREELTDETGLLQLDLMKKCGVGVKYVFRPTEGDAGTTIIDIKPATIASF